MALAFTLVDTWDDGQRIHVAGTVAASGNYTTSGDTLDLSQWPIIATTQAPIQGTAWMDGLAGYDYVFYPGSRDEQRQGENFPARIERRRVSRNWPQVRIQARSPPTRSPSTESSRSCCNGAGQRTTDLTSPV